MTGDAGGASPTAIERRVDPQHPWPGLLAFQEIDREFFFGRDAEAEELLALVMHHRVTVLFGLSGLGKTSLLGAGLFPRLRQRDFLPLRLRLDVGADEEPSAQVIAALVQECGRSDVEAPQPIPGESIWEYLHRADVAFWSPRNRLLTPVLVFDQFEEIFSRLAADGRGPERRARVVEMIADLAEGRVPAVLKRRLAHDPSGAEALTFDTHRYHLLLALREDYLPNLEELVGEMPALRRSRMRLTHMRGDMAVRSVVAAGSAAGIVTPGVAREIVRFIGASSATASRDALLDELPIEPALLSVVCRELNRQRIARGAATIAVSQLDSGEGILKRFYEDATRDLPDALRDALERRFITADGTREMVAYQTLAAVPGVSEDDIQRLIDRRILRTEYREGRRLLELTHDRLAPVVRDYRRQREQQDELERARQEHLAAVKARSARKLRLLAIGLAALLLVSVLATIAAISNARNLELAQAEESRQRQLAEVRRVEAVTERLQAEAATAEAIGLRQQETALKEKADQAAAVAQKEREAADLARKQAEADREAAVRSQKEAEAARDEMKLALDEARNQERQNAQLEQQYAQQKELVQQYTAIEKARAESGPTGATGAAGTVDAPATATGRGVRLRVRDVYGKPIDRPLQVNIRSADGRSIVNRSVGSAADVLSFSFSDAQYGVPYAVTASAAGYRTVGKFVVLGPTAPTVDMTLPVNPQAVRQVSFPAYDALSAKAKDILERSRLGAPDAVSGASLYQRLDDLLRASLLNFLAVAGATITSGNRSVLDAIVRIDLVRPTQISAVVQPSLRNDIRDSETFRQVAGALAGVPPGFQPAGAFKSDDRSVSLRVTFFASEKSPESMTALFELDSGGGLGHVFQVADRGSQTEHPYDLHELMVFSLKLDPKYQLNP